MVANKGGASRNDVSDMGSGGATLKKGPWTAAEDAILMEYVRKHGEGNWNAFQKNSGLSRCGKSCRLRWANHLRPNLKKGSFSPDEERLILELHSKLGNKWARMAAQLPGRTDNEIKNYWNTRVKRRQRSGLPLYPHNKQKQARAFHLHQHNQPHPSPSPPTIPLSRSQQKKPSFGSSLSMFEPMKFSTTTPLFGHQDSTHFRNTNIGFSHPFNPPTSAQPSSLSLFNQNFSTQSLPKSTLHFNSHNYNLNPPTDNMVPHGFTFSTKMELPSSQLPQPSVPTVALGTTNDNRLSPSLAQTNSGLLDAILQDVEVIGGGEGGVRREGLLPSHEEKSGLDEFIGETPPNSSFFNESPTALQLGSPNHLDDSGSVGVRTKKESTDETHSMDDDGLSSLLGDIIPSTMLVSDFYNHGGELSNRQSSGVTFGDLGQDMQQLPLPTNLDYDWNVGVWNHVPEMY